MTDEELIDLYHAALCSYEHAKSYSGDRVHAFIQLVSAQMAMISRFGGDYMRHYGRRHEVDIATVAASGAAFDRAVVSRLPAPMN